MGYVEKNLISGEQVAYRSGLHWIVLLRAMVVAALLGLLGVVMLVEGSQVKGTQPRAGRVRLWRHRHCDRRDRSCWPR